MMPRTRIVATLGPATQSLKSVETLLRAGADVMRLNFSHGDAQWHRSLIGRIRRAARKLNRHVAILGDLPGPKIRLGKLDPEEFRLEEGERFFLTPNTIEGGPEGAAVRYKNLLQDVTTGDRVALNDGAAVLRVTRKQRGKLICKVEQAGPIASNKGVSFPGVNLGAPSLTAADRKWIRFGVEQQVDLFALSFVRKPQDVKAARRAVQRAGGSIPILAKIEKHEAVENLAAIVEEADGAMAARGDLGVEYKLEETPRVQKRLIRLCNRAAKPVITATQMLESMVESRRPTRAEVSDVANAILDGTDAVMLSAETAIGSFPAETVSMMRSIAETIEADLQSVSWFGDAPPNLGAKSDEAIAHSAVEIAKSIGATAILCCTTSGATARRVGRYRPRTLILASSHRQETLRRLQLSWGIQTIQAHDLSGKVDLDDIETVLRDAVEAALASGQIKRGQKIVATAGAPLYQSGNTNLIRVIDL